VTKPIHYYVAAGSLSSVLDMPDLCELPATRGDDGPAALPADAPARESTEAEAVAAMRANPAEARLIIAVSLGAVSLGHDYIGNGPNFMVKSIAESAGVKVPLFVGYILRYSLPILLPILLRAAFCSCNPQDRRRDHAIAGILLVRARTDCCAGVGSPLAGDHRSPSDLPTE